MLLPSPPRLGHFVSSCPNSAAEVPWRSSMRAGERVVGLTFWESQIWSWNILKHLETSWNSRITPHHIWLEILSWEWTLDGKLDDFGTVLSNLSDALATLRRPERSMAGVPRCAWHTNCIIRMPWILSYKYRITVHWFYMYPHMCKNTRLVEWGA